MGMQRPPPAGPFQRFCGRYVLSKYDSEEYYFQKDIGVFRYNVVVYDAINQEA